MHLCTRACWRGHFWAHTGGTTRTCLGRAQEEWRTHLLDACKGDARVYWRVYAGARVSSWCTRVLDCAFAQGDVGVWSPLLCTLVQCRCGHLSPKDAGVWA